jgi:glycine/D-amino acid oxidase-like deaminating enzyme
MALPQTKMVRPTGWKAEHDTFVRGLARHGEDANSIVILFETEYPRIKISKAWIMETMKART